MVIAGAYLRKSNDEADKAADAKSIAVQRDLVESFAITRGWTLDERFVFADDGVTGATYERPGLKALLAAATTKQFTKLLVVEQSRIGRGDAIDTLFVIRQIEQAGVEIWESRSGNRISLQDDASELLAYLSGWRDKSERKKTITRVRDAAAKRFASGLVVSGCPYGYIKTAREAGSKAALKLVIDEARAAVVRRVFDMAAKGQGLIRIARQLNRENIIGPRGRRWSVSGVRELLHRETYIGTIVYGKQVRTGPDERVRVTDPTKWSRRTDEALRIVPIELWDAAHARIKATAAKLLRNRDGQLLAQVEAIKGRGQYLLSGFLVCGARKIGTQAVPGLPGIVLQGDICGEPMVATKRGRGATSVYVCRGWREGRDSCEGRAGVPMVEMDAAVISSLRRTFSTESFERHLRQVADDVEAREQRRAEREHLLVEIPKLAAAEVRLAKAIARTDEADALVAELKATQQERRDAEARVAYLEGVEMDVKADRDRVEQLREQWGTWSQYLDDDPLLARQVLRKVLVSPIKVTPRAVDGAPAWRFIGVSRYDGVLAGGLTKGEVVRVPVDPALISILDESYEPLAAHPLGLGPHPISGGSGDTIPAWEPTVCDSSRPPMKLDGRRGHDFDEVLRRGQPCLHGRPRRRVGRIDPGVPRGVHVAVDSHVGDVHGGGEDLRLVAPDRRQGFVDLLEDLLGLALGVR
jgi:site-specific DNA recombinase